jgi:hypothetical protein
MHPAAAVGMLAIVVIAAAAILLLHRATLEKAQLLDGARTARPDPPSVQIRSPAFVATNSGGRYHIGCIVGEDGYEYGLWTTRSHRVVRTFEPTETGWTEAWTLFVRLERDEAPSWIDHRGAPRSRREWDARPAGRLNVAASANDRNASGR